MTQCPHCGKRLLSQASARCNWCGATINNADYQAHAQTERDAYFAHAAAHDAQSLAATEALFIPGTPMAPFMLAPIMAPRRIPSIEHAKAVQPAPKGSSPCMPARKTQQPKENQGQAKSSADSGPIKNEAEEAGERFRHLEL